METTTINERKRHLQKQEYTFYRFAHANVKVPI